MKPIERYNRLSEAQRARFIGFLLGGDVPEAVLRDVGNALTYAESVHPAGDLAPKAERPHEALRRIARERGEGL